MKNAANIRIRPKPDIRLRLDDAEKLVKHLVDCELINASHRVH